MKILSCIPYHYYNSFSVPLSYYYVPCVLRSMGHTVHVFEYIEQAERNKEGVNDFFLSVVKNVGYDLVFIETSRDEFYPEVLDEACKYTVVLGWNSDDDWRWDNYSSKWYPHYSFMVTTYRHIYESHKATHPNLLLSQWAATGLFDGIKSKKDIPISFIGGIYGERVPLLTALRGHVPIHIYSHDSLPAYTKVDKLRKKVAEVIAGRQIGFKSDSLSYEEVNDIWNRSVISLTPLWGGKDNKLQIKGRVFEVGTSGSVMLCNHNPELYPYYEPGREFVEFDSLQDCRQKAKYLLSHEIERNRIADAYYKRTRGEHLWQHRYSILFKTIGLSN